MSEPMMDVLRQLPADLGDQGYGGDGPDDPERVLAADAVRWAIAEIERLREERRIVAWGVQFSDGEVVPFEDKQIAELRVKDGNCRIALAGGPADGLRLVALSIEPLQPERETETGNG